MTATKPVPEPTALTQLYWDAAARGELSMPWCSACGTWNFPPRPRCPGCGEAQMQWRSPARTGEIVTFTVVHQTASEAYRDDVPYVVVIVRLDGGPELMTNLVGVDDLDSVAVGQRVELTFERRGEIFQVPQFRPAAVTTTANCSPGRSGPSGGLEGACRCAGHV
jgi:hypothetical protein